tara:strand:- start:7002 stop:8456 length:1455 start_codon:yes stop_codon:yes gene_type:complete
MRQPFFILIPISILMGSFAFPRPNEPCESPANRLESELHLNSSGEAIYEQWCASCHGTNGRDFLERIWKLGSQQEDLERVIASGHPLLGMPAYRDALSAEDIRNVAEYVLSKAKESPSFLAAPPLFVQASDIQLRANIIADGLDTPWGMDFLNDTALIFTEREGKLWTIQSGIKQEVTGLPHDIHAKGQGGLLDVMHWTESENQQNWIYLSYSKNHPNDKKLSATAVVRSRITKSKQGFKVDEWETIMVATPYGKTHHHYGSRLAMGNDNMLYITCGERGLRDVHPQSLETYPGKVHRLHPDGKVPQDNPFVAVTGAIPSIWSWGHRNPQGMLIHPETGAIWTHEHGPKGGDEINVLKKAANYGWPEITFGRNYSGTVITRDTAKVGMEQPLHYWLPSIGACGMEIIHGDNWPEPWQNNLLVGSLSFEYLERLVIDSSGRVSGREELLNDIGRVRDIARNQRGDIYVAVEGAGLILHLEPILEN